MKLLEPIEIKGMKLKNRIGFPPFMNVPAGEDGHINDLTIRWYEERAKGGAGLIMTAPLRFSAPGGPAQGGVFGMRGIALYDDKYIPGLARLAEVMHSYDAKLGVELAAGGPMGGRGPSPAPYPDERHATDEYSYVMMGRRMPVTEVSIEEIEQIEDDIAAAAARAKAAGFDCVDLDIAHGGATLHGSFMSPFYNRRTDKYGGDWEGRLRLPIETIQKIRGAVGED